MQVKRSDSRPLNQLRLRRLDDDEWALDAGSVALVLTTDELDHLIETAQEKRRHD